MPLPRRRLAFALFTLLPLVVRGHAPGEDMAVAARAWLATLDPALRAQAAYPFADAERENWHFIPRARQGVPFKAMAPAQQEAARALLATGLSAHGVLRVETIRGLEEILRAIEGAARRDSALYYVTVFGEPAEHGTWGWRVEGHHLSINLTVIEGHAIAATPLFMGANPAEVRLPGPARGQRALAEEEDLGRALVQSLDPAQLRTALLSATAPGEIVTGSDRQATLERPAGVSYAALTPPQQAQLGDLVRLYASRLRPELADAEMRKIADRGWHTLTFAWAGGHARGEPHYYRIHGPHFVIEYDNTQNDANHVHTVWRDFTGDFGRDVLRAHYQAAHPSPANPAPH